MPSLNRKKIPPLTALRSFEAAARHCSFRDAADELCVSHSAVSHQVKQLEQYLGVELFLRKARAVELSRAGSIYYPVVRDAFDRLAEGTDLLLAPRASNVLTVQLYSSFAIRWLIPRLPQFNKAHPDIQLRLSTSQQDVNFEHDDVDVGVLIGARTMDNLHYDYLFTSQLFPLASPSIVNGDKPIESPADLRNHTILQVYPSKRDWYVWLNGAGVEGVEPESGARFDSYDHALYSAAQGMGVALGMEPYTRRDLESGALVELFPEMRVRAAGDWYLACRQERADSDKIAIFRDWLLNEVALDPDLASR